MVRGTFANVRIQNRLVPGVEGGYTKYLPVGEQMSIYDAAMEYQKHGTPLIVIAGKEYGTGSSRDWAAKGPSLLGVKAVIAQSYERIHRSNLIGMGILPLEFHEGDTPETLGLNGTEVYRIDDLAKGMRNGFSESKNIAVETESEHARTHGFSVTVRLDTPQEVEYYRHGGILQYVLRQLLATRNR